MAATMNEGDVDLEVEEAWEQGCASLVPDKSRARFFHRFSNGKCTNQVVGMNTIGRVPSNIAKFSNLNDPDSYTGHAFGRTSATLLANTGADTLALKRHGGWKSSTVAEGYPPRDSNTLPARKQVARESTRAPRSTGGTARGREKKGERAIAAERRGVRIVRVLSLECYLDARRNIENSNFPGYVAVVIKEETRVNSDSDSFSPSVRQCC
ncbi:hypothetical protein ANN_22080 [Periplaneta americana]|uniref:Uncharacterized protein n=1 Tax=Periplaneta americana TaxID=6978 RepID=A0ABQ8S7X6_PERAM|nr:hypothetical protein ANN_22080 [Periplaneta americana]